MFNNSRAQSFAITINSIILAVFICVIIYAVNQRSTELNSIRDRLTTLEKALKIEPQFEQR